MALLREHNPVPSSELSTEEHDQQEQLLGRILGGHGTEQSAPKTKTWMFAAAATVTIMAGALVVPTMLPQPANAQQVLIDASEAAGKASDLTSAGVAGQQFQRRVDADDSGAVTTSMKIDSSGILRVDVSDVPEGISSELAQFAGQLRAHNGEPLEMVAEANETGGNPAQLKPLLEQHYGNDTARGVLEFLLLPGIDAQATKGLYKILAELPGNEVARKPATKSLSNDEVVTIEREDGLILSVLPASGRLIEVQNLVAPGLTTTVQAAGLLGCVNIVEQNAPEEVSLACADQNYLLKDLEWDNWNAPEARAEATA